MSLSMDSLTFTHKKVTCVYAYSLKKKMDERKLQVEEISDGTGKTNIWMFSEKIVKLLQ